MIEVLLLGSCQQIVQYPGNELGEDCRLMYQIDADQYKITVLSIAKLNTLHLHRVLLQEWLIRHLIEQNQIQVDHKGMFNLATTFVAANIKLNVEKRNPTMKELATVLDKLVVWVETENHQQALSATFSQHDSQAFTLSTLPAFFQAQTALA